MGIDTDNIDFHALLTDEYIAVANRGRPFTKEDLFAVCQPNISTKGHNDITNNDNMFNSKKEAEGLLKEIQSYRLDKYKPRQIQGFELSDIKGDVTAEYALRDEYAGRILPELLQNAHDARAVQKIGRKGIGFNAVLNICDGPRFHSGYLHFGFDRSRSLKLIQERYQSIKEVPILRLPFPVSQEQEPKQVRELVEKYDTVIVLPFTDNQSRERFLPHWEKCAKDGKLLLFLESDGLNRIVWERNDETGVSKYDWSRRVEDGHVEIHGNTPDKQMAERWRIYKSERAAVAVKLHEDGSPAPYKDENVRVFFETREQSPLPLLIHAKFPLEQGRNNVFIEDGNISDIVEEVADLVYDALDGVSNTGVFLDLLNPRIEPEQMRNIEKQLWGAFKTRLSDISIPNTKQVQLSQVRLRPEHRIWGYDCNLWNDFKSILHEHNRDQFLQLPLLPPGVDSDDRDNTILYFNPDARLSEDEITELPIIPVTGHDCFIAANKSNIFFPPEKNPPQAPRDVEIRFLDQNFVELIREHGQSKIENILLKELLHVSEFKPLSLLSAILPILRKTDVQQPAGLIDFLFSAVEPELADEDIIFNWKEPARKKVSELLKLPVRGGDERPVKEVYAGSDWTGNDFLEKAYGNNNERDFLKPPPTDEEEKKRWQRFYQWLGVGWCPKILPVVNPRFEDHRETKQEAQWIKTSKYFQITTDKEPPHWREYCDTIHKDRAFDHRYAPRMQQNWTLDGGEELLMREGIFSLIGNNWDYYKIYKGAYGCQYSTLKKKAEVSWHCQSYFIWLLKNNAWVPVKQTAKKQNPEDVFQTPEISNEIGGWTFQIQDDAEKDFLEAIGVRRGWTAIMSEDWQRWLQAAAGLSKEQIHSRKENVKSLYLAALRHWRDNNRDHYSGLLWGIKQKRDNTEEWRRLNEQNSIYYVDRPDLHDLRIPDCYIFPIELNQLQDSAKTKLRLKLLSEHLSGQPVEPEEIKELSERLSQRTKEHIKFINAFLKQESSENALFSSGDTIPEVKVINQLKIQFKIDGTNIDRPMRAYHSQTEDGLWELWLDNEIFRDTKLPTMACEHIASALVYAGELSLDKQPIFKDLLYYENLNLEHKLLQLGLTQDSINEMKVKPIQPMETETIEALTALGETKLPRNSGQPRETNEFETGFKTVTRSSHNSRNRGSGSSTSGRASSAPNVEAGKKAEKRIRTDLKNRLEPLGWQVSCRPTRDEQRRETDIELKHKEHGAYHVEVKHCESGYVYWSEKEVSKALKHHGRYLMVIVQGGDEKHQQYWIKYPTDELISPPRKGVWVWRSQLDVPYQPVQNNPWAVPSSRKERSADGFSFKIDVTRWIAEREPNHCPLFDLDRETNTLTD